MNEQIQHTHDTKAINKLGVLYAKYGLTEKAKVEFEKVVEQRLTLV